MILDIEPDFGPKNKNFPERFYLLEYKSSRRISKTYITSDCDKKSKWLLIILIRFSFLSIANLLTFTKCEEKLTKVLTVKSLQLWLIFVLMLSTQSVNGQEFFSAVNLSLMPASNISIKFEYSKYLNPSEFENFNKEIYNQSSNYIGISKHHKKLNDVSNNASAYNYSLINLSQSKNVSNVIYNINHNIHKRQPRYIRLENENKKKKTIQKTRLPRIDEARLKRLVLNGLGMKKIPDMRKVNISQFEYSSKYIEYLARLKRNQENGVSHSGSSFKKEQHLLSIVSNSFNDVSYKRWRHKRSYNNSIRRSLNKKEPFKDDIQSKKDKTNILLYFPLFKKENVNFQHDKIDEANVRLMLLYSSSLASNVRRLQGPGKETFSHTNGNYNSRKVHNNCKNNSLNQQKEYKKRFQNRQINIKVYQVMSSNRRSLLSSQKIEFDQMEFEETRTQWLEFDVTKAVRGWLKKSHENLGIEIQCDRCNSIGARILNDISPTRSTTSASDSDRLNIMPVLNIIGLGTMQSHWEGNHKVHHIMLANNGSDEYVHHSSDHDPIWRRRKWNNNCFKLHQRCCRNQLDVVFKNVKGFEFILQPKVFDAGYCHGRCPPRHNPAHHHALLQSLIWQEDHSRAPRPCCAPSKLAMLEILHVDEEHSDKLKISTWTDMQVVECACS